LFSQPPEAGDADVDDGLDIAQEALRIFADDLTEESGPRVPALT
jgi:hypothetical protein